MREQNVRPRMFGEIGINRRAVHRVPARWISAIGPIKLAALLFEMELLRREGLAFANDGYAILTVEISALDRTVVLARNAHVGPVNVSGFNIDNDAVRNSTPGYNDFPVGAVGVS